MTEQRGRGPRSTVELDVASGNVRMGSVEQRVRDVSDPQQLYPAYLSCLYAVRGARRGEEIPLRSDDLEALLAIVGEDPDYIERKLVELMGCTEEEASLLRRVLLRHKALTAGVGVAAGLSLLALIGPASATAPSTPLPSSPAAVVPADPSQLPPVDPYLTTDDGAHVAPPASWESEVVTSPSVAQAEAPAGAAPSAKSAPSPAPASSEVVLGEPMVPIDRPAADSEVVLGEPMVPIDRPAPDSEVVLGEPMVPIDRPDAEAVDTTQNTGSPDERIGWTPNYPVEPKAEQAAEPTPEPAESNDSAA